MTKIIHAACAAMLPLTCVHMQSAWAAAPQFTTLYHFSQSTSGESFITGTLAVYGGALYGAAGSGGSAGKGTVFQLDLASLAETTLYNFTGGKTQGASPFGSLSRHGALIYGSTTDGHAGPGSSGNDSGYGTIWRLNARTQNTRLFHGFSGTDGKQPYSGVVPVGNVLYGATWYGGPENKGTVFKLDSTGKLTQLYTFPENAVGCNPLAAVTIVGSVLYGTTTFCGASGTGTVFALDLDSGKASVLHSFASNGNSSAQPNALVYQDGVLYGTTFDDGGAGDVYKIDVKTGQYSVVHQFSGGADGRTPSSGLTILDGKLYGVTEAGGADGYGTIYSIDPATGSQTVVYSFTSGTDGDTPFAGLLADNGALYGSTLNNDAEYPNPHGSLFKFVP